MRRRQEVSLLMLTTGLALLVAAAAGVASSTPRKAGSSEARRGGVLRVAASGGGFDTLDPQLQYVSNDAALLYSTQMLLVNFPNKPGGAGTILRPDGATAMPMVSGSGKVYTFHIRKNLRFSDGSPVTAAAWQRAFERVLSPRQYVQNGCILGIDRMIVGGEKFANCERKAGVATSPHIAGIAANGLTLTFHLTKPNPAFVSILAMPWFGAVKPSMPYTRSPSGVGTYASAGPYFIATLKPLRLVVLKRNRYYRGPLLQNPGRIVIRENQGSGEAQVLRIEQGRLDTDFSQVPSDQVAALAEKYGGPNRSQFHVAPTLCTLSLAFDTTLAPTNDVRIRRALSYALGRTPIIELLGPYAGAATDQILLPGIPGYRKLSLYPNYPDVAKAKEVGGSALQTAAPLTIYAPPSGLGRSIAELEQSEIEQIGLTVKLVSSPASHHNNIRPEGWCADYLDPSDAIGALAGRLDPSIHARAAHAASLTGGARVRAYAALDRLLMTRYVPVFPVMIENARYLTAKRVHNVIISRSYGAPILNAMSVG